MGKSSGAPAGGVNVSGALRVPACSGCGLRSKDAPVAAPLAIRKGLTILYRSGTEDEIHAGRRVPAALQRADERLKRGGLTTRWMPALRCAYGGGGGALKFRMRGANNLTKRLQGCWVDGFAWGAVKPKDRTLVLLGGPVYQATMRAITGAKPPNWADVWGTYLTAGKQGLRVYVAADWTQGVTADPRLMRTDLARLLQPPEPAQPAPFTVVSSKAFLSGLKRVDLRYGPVAADIETSGFSPRDAVLRCIGVTHPSIGTLVLPVHTMGGRKVLGDKRLNRVVAHLAKLPTVWHNAPFDTGWLTHLTGIRFGPETLDTMSLHRHVYERAPHPLSVACSMEWYTGGWKDGLNHGLDARDEAQLYAYNAVDCWYTWRLLRKLCGHYLAVYGRDPYPRAGWSWELAPAGDWDGTALETA